MRGSSAGPAGATSGSAANGTRGSRVDLDAARSASESATSIAAPRGDRGRGAAAFRGVARFAGLPSAVSTAAVLRLLEVEVPSGVHSTADAAVEVLELLHHATRRGVRVQEFTGVARPAGW